MQITNDFQARCAATILAKRHITGRLEKLVPVFLRSGLEVYPHQIEAATQAIYNPYSKGFILADEVGLGKAVEAGLIIAQSYYDGADNIIVIVPKQQIEQWRRLLTERFGLPVKQLGDTEKTEDEQKSICLATYESAVANINGIKETAWDLVVIDEAHRLRKFGQGESVRSSQNVQNPKGGKTAEILHTAFDNRKKILLTATPIIGNIMDLWGLVTFIDDTVLGDANEFYKWYYKKPENYAELKELLQPFIFRTLRRQVKADVLLPERLIYTEQYKLNDKELELYKGLEQYLNKEKKIAFPEMDPYELNLMMFKLFSSSIYALSKTLAGILIRLRKGETPEARKEATEIEHLLNLATKVTETSKDAAFIKTLAQTFHSLKEKGLPQKVVVFTENRETKNHIIKLLQTRTKWNAIAFEGSDDIEKFKEKAAHILVATDMASEGFNIEFCNTIINFDLPWALQKVEQRIGRLHRIGQKNDVLVFNFLNDENFADVRIYELAYRRTVTTSDILGTSDNFISGADLGKDTAQAVADMVATGRNAAEVAADFENLQEQFAEFVGDNKRAGNEILFNTFDERVAEKTKNYAEFIRAKVAETKALLWEFCKHAVKEYGTVDNVNQSIFIHRSPFSSGNIPNMSLNLNDDGTRSRASLITLTNATVKRLIDNYTGASTLYGSVTVQDDKRRKGEPEQGKIALYNVQFMNNVRMATVSVFVGQTADGRTLSEDECKWIIEGAEDARYDQRENENAKKTMDELLAKALPEIEANIAAELNDSVAAEIKQIKRRTRVALQQLENEIKLAESEINKLKGAGSERSDNVFAGNQHIFDAANRLNLLKQNEFIDKMKYKKQEADNIAALTSKAKLMSYKTCRFVVEYTVK